LNDGSIAYNQHTNVDSLAFGHCDYSYRNLGRPSVIKIEQSSSIFQVTVDDKVCFQTPKVALPAGNVFGVTAATPDNPDSFELFKFLVTPGAQPAAQQFSEQTTQQQIPVEVRAESNDRSNSINLGSLDDMNSRIHQIVQEVSQISRHLDERHQELLNRILSVSSSSSGSSSGPPSDSSQNDARLGAITDRLRRIENTLTDMQRDGGRDYRNQLNKLQKTIENSHVSLTEALQTSIFNSRPLPPLFVSWGA
jgi:lectin, mannose-binding 1